ncbi:class I SAM-dependent methyltransferase [Maritimibacter dapengensis]|uniref:Class I SAM-dependent methyltransferase n=1 Tax=Maritimibacter dapengensis TaxID=2836868 RepID=A0ABS6T4I8_9RHOB|nr:class I SAM-dependent methyltransferase [Maritimibacter dapengensis]MBV7380105.1 class I SAM-dependent methyltransferase [Maritimibacter dapengensis]
MSKRYIASPIGDPDAYEHKLDLTRKYLRSDMDVLEIGCGSGNTGRKHAPLVGSYTAMDISSEMIERGRALGDVPANMRYVHGNFDEVETTPARYDMVLALSVLHLLPDPAATVKKIAASLKPGGYFVSSTVRTGNIAILRLIAPVGQALGLVPHLSFIKGDDIRRYITEAGLEIVEEWEKNPRSALFLIAQKMV